MVEKIVRERLSDINIGRGVVGRIKSGINGESVSDIKGNFYGNKNEAKEGDSYTLSNTSIWWLLRQIRVD